MKDRIRKAGKISSILIDFCGKELHSSTCLDLGCSSGVISAQLTNIFKKVIGFDIDYASLSIAQNNKLQKLESPFYILGDGSYLPFDDGRFDVVICAQVYEHMPDAVKMVKEIARVLKLGGFCFFSGPNRLSIMEEHYWLPFLSWLPKSLASIYMKFMRRGNVYDAYPMTYWQLTRVWVGFEVHDYTLKILHEPRRFFVDDRVEKYGIIKFAPDWLINILRPFYPNYKWILVKKDE
jgi:2-polyprenyl-3-methyl-5-hydroxy-6-metoxy-1,4-benzoquinol methylase